MFKNLKPEEIEEYKQIKKSIKEVSNKKHRLLLARMIDDYAIWKDINYENNPKPRSKSMIEIIKDLTNK